MLNAQCLKIFVRKNVNEVKYEKSSEIEMEKKNVWKNT